MRRTFIAMLLISICTSVICQVVQPSAKIKAAFTKKEISTMNSAEIEFLNFALENGFIITENQEKAFGLPDLLTSYPKSKDQLDSGNFNPLSCGLNFLQTENQYFRIGETGKTLFVYSKERLEVLYQRNKANQQNDTKFSAQ